MRRKIYLAFLGAGNYEPTVYCIGDKQAHKTPYVQVAEIELYGKYYFDKIYIVVTSTSKEKHFNKLLEEFSELGIDKDLIDYIEISEELDTKHQWKGFETILDKIQKHDELVVDLTHGFRIIPIVFSTAIYFLQKIKKISLTAVYYGAYEKDKNKAPIIDIKDFYIVNEWADAIGRLVDDADTGKLAYIASQDNKDFRLNELKQKELLKSFEEITKSIKGVELNQISLKACDIINTINRISQNNNISITTSILLSIINNKFKPLASKEVELYSKEYFDIQLNFIELLLEHKLFMQCFTAMREFIISIADMEVKKQIQRLFETEWQNKGNKKRKKYLLNSRKYLSDKIIGMLRAEEKDWDLRSYIDPDGEKGKKILLPVYNKFREIGIEDKLRKLVPELVKYRNGFDHGWTNCKEQRLADDIDQKAKEFYKMLQDVNNTFSKKLQ